MREFRQYQLPLEKAAYAWSNPILLCGVRSSMFRPGTGSRLVGRHSIALQASLAHFLFSIWGY